MKAKLKIADCDGRVIDTTYRLCKMYGMNTKLTLRMDEALVSHLAIFPNSGVIIAFLTYHDM